MNVSHIVYKVNDLQQSVDYFKREGFQVEYGSKINPHNALIYFSEGPYIELVEGTPLKFPIKVFLKLMGKRKVVERLERWQTEEEGPVEICLENYEANFEQEELILKKYKQPYFITKSKRLDPKDRLLKWKLLFPYELRMPFLMTYFNISPKPKNFTHPNGIKQIKRISYGTTPSLLPLIKELCEDKTLNLFIGNGVRDIVYDGGRVARL